MIFLYCSFDGALFNGLRYSNNRYNSFCRTLSLYNRCQKWRKEIKSNNYCYRKFSRVITTNIGQINNLMKHQNLFLILSSPISFSLTAVSIEIIELINIAPLSPKPIYSFLIKEIPQRNFLHSKTLFAFVLIIRNCN